MNIYISDLGHQVTEESLTATFATHGTVHSTTMMADEHTGHARGFAFVVMHNASEGAAAIQRINGSIMDGCLVKAAEVIEPPQAHPAAHLSRP